MARPPSAIAPFGYRYVTRTVGGGVARLAVVENEARIVREIFAWIGLARVSLHEVCRRLAEAGCRTRTGLPRWDRTTICGMRKNSADLGRAAFKRSRFLPAQPRLRPIRGHPWPARKPNTRVPAARSAWIAIPVPGLVEPDLFAAAQAQLQENRRQRREGRRRPGWLLQGLGSAAVCGYAFYGKMARGRIGAASTSCTMVPMSRNQAAAVDRQIDGLRWGIGRRIDSYPQGVIDHDQFQPPHLWPEGAARARAENSAKR